MVIISDGGDDHDDEPEQCGRADDATCYPTTLVLLQFSDCKLGMF